MRRLSATIAILVFFLLAGVAMARSVPVFDCAVRGLIGAVVMYVVAQVAGKAIVSVVVDAVLKSKSNDTNTGAQQ